jgi:hypothetical protein
MGTHDYRPVDGGNCDCPGPPGAFKRSSAFPTVNLFLSTVNLFWTALLHGRAGRLTAKKRRPPARADYCRTPAKAHGLFVENAHGVARTGLGRV